MNTVGTSGPAPQSADSTPRTSARGCRIRRGALVTAAALSLGLGVAAPSLAAEQAPHRALLQDWQGWSTSQGQAGSQTSGSPYGAGDLGGSSASRPATAAESTGVALIDTVLPYQNGQAAGTGMVLTSTGKVLTNYHVVHGAGSIRVTIASTGNTYQATVVGTDQADDVALIQLTGASGLATVRPDTAGVGVGSRVTAVGNAGGTGTLSAADGQITGVDASVTAASEDGASPETLGGMLETNADVQAGDSGGPLFDAQGEVVGIDTAGSSGGVPDAYAIPITRALSIAEQIESGHETSTVRIGPAAFLGVEVTDAASAGYGSGYGSGYGAGDGYGPTAGAQVSGVLSGAAAANAGLQSGDVITSLNGRSISSPEDVSTALAQSNPGDRVAIAWTSQDGSQHTAQATLGASPVA